MKVAFSIACAYQVVLELWSERYTQEVQVKEGTQIFVSGWVGKRAEGLGNLARLIWQVREYFLSQWSKKKYSTFHYESNKYCIYKHKYVLYIPNMLFLFAIPFQCKLNVMQSTEVVCKKRKEIQLNQFAQSRFAITLHSFLFLQAILVSTTLVHIEFIHYLFSFCILTVSIHCMYGYLTYDYNGACPSWS